MCGLENLLRMYQTFNMQYIGRARPAPTYVLIFLFMFFNKKMLLGLANAVGVLLILAFILNVVMYVWAYFGVPPLQFFDKAQGVAVSYYLLLNKLGTLIFLYVFTGALAGLIKSSKL